jgi:hypothetical protein
MSMAAIIGAVIIRETVMPSLKEAAGAGLQQACYHHHVTQKKDMSQPPP